MGLPNLPPKKRKEAYLDLLESIAQEEKALAALIHAETEKIKAFVCYIDHNHCSLSMREIILLQDAMKSVLTSAVKMQMLLHGKLEHVLDSLVYGLVLPPEPSKPPQPAGSCWLFGRGQGTITNQLDPFWGGTAHLTDLQVIVEEGRTIEALFTYRAKMQDVVLRLTGLGQTIVVHDPAIAAGDTLVVSGRAVVDLLKPNLPPQTAESVFTLTVWRLDETNSAPGQFQLVVAPDGNECINHDSGIIRSEEIRVICY